LPGLMSDEDAIIGQKFNVGIRVAIFGGYL
jgi:hypothetical protein